MPQIVQLGGVIGASRSFGLKIAGLGVENVKMENGLPFLLESGAPDVLVLENGTDAAISALTELATPPAGTDELYVNDDGTSKKITVKNLQRLHRGATITKSGDTATLNATSAYRVNYNQAEYDTEDAASRNRIWLGADAAFTAEADDEKLTLSSHGMIQGDGPFQVSNSGGALPTGLSAATDYWAAVVDTVNTFQVATSHANAIAGTNVTLSDDGTGTQTLERERRLVVPTGVTRVRVNAGVNILDLQTSKWVLQDIRKNGVAGSGAATAGLSITRFELAAATTYGGNIQTGVLTVAAGDYFEHNIAVETDTSITLRASGTWFSLEILE